MNKKTISDIRLFKSKAQNEYGIYSTEYFGDKSLTAIVNRIVMKLRENEFSLGEFDHLYINFTTCDMAEKMDLSNKSDRHHPWLRYCNVHVEDELYSKLDSPETQNEIILHITNVLTTYFTSADFSETNILSCVRQAVEQGEGMLMKFKEKVTSKRKAVIFLRFLDTCRFYPLLRVYDAEENILFEKDLPPTVTLDYLGEIQVGVKHVTIKPRKNTYTAQNQPMTFDY